jgi:hypothetical protein
MLSLLMTLVVCAAEPSTPPSEAKPDNQAEAKESREIAEKEVVNFKFTLGTDASEELKLEATPVLRWTNHLRRRFYGDIYVWTRNGRPEVVASITNLYDPRRRAEAEIHSLSLEQPKLKRSGSLVWEPSRAGVELKPIQDAPIPADSAAARLRQLKALASEFSASSGSGKARTELRLLPQPVSVTPAPIAKCWTALCSPSSRGLIPTCF